MLGDDQIPTVQIVRMSPISITCDLDRHDNLQLCIFMSSLTWKPNAHVFNLVPVITRLISVANDVAVLYFTLSATWGILRTRFEIRASAPLTSMLVKNGRRLLVLIHK